MFQRQFPRSALGRLVASANISSRLATCLGVALRRSHEQAFPARGGSAYGMIESSGNMLNSKYLPNALKKDPRKSHRRRSGRFYLLPGFLIDLTEQKPTMNHAINESARDSWQ